MGRNYWLLSSLCLLELAVLQQPLKAQVTPTADATGTTVDIESNQFNISGGTRVGDNLFHRFDTLNLSADQIANFLSDPNVQLILGQISGGNASYIDGLLQVSGSGANLYLLNPTGILFGPNARLNIAGSFTATTADRLSFNGGELDIFDTTDYAHLVGTPHSLVFSSGNPGSIVNQGQLSVSPGHSLRLTGGNVLNTGTLTAPGGEITLAAVPGESRIRLSQANQLIGLDLAAAPLETNQLAPATLAELLTGGQPSGATQLVTNADGSIALTVYDTKFLAATTLSSGQLSAAGEIGGQINVLGQQVGILNADIDASGDQGGGTIRIGGDARGQGTVPNATITVVDDQSILQANARSIGNGGQITVWADHTARFSGTATARGGAASGNGGHVETSGQHHLDITGGTVDASAPSGEAGLWLLDPTDIEIVDSASGTPTGGLFAPATTGTASQISPATIEAALDRGTSLEITTSNGVDGGGDITLIDSINQTGGGNASLTLTGRRFIQNGSTDEINLTSTGGLTFNLNQVNPETTPTTASIQHALDAIGNVAGDRTITLGAGTYLTNGTPITIDREVTLTGSSANDTILDGGQLSRIVEITNTTTTLQDLTLRRGATLANESGGAIYNTGNLTLLGTRIENNTATGNGGGLYNSGSLSVINSTIHGNQALNGGGIENLGGTLSLLNSQVTNNIATATRSQSHLTDHSQGGGGIFNRDGGTLTINQSEVSNNISSVLGGGILNFGNGNVTTTTVIDSTIANNIAEHRGGGIQTASISGSEGTTVLDITNSTLSGNQAGFLGGGIRTVGNTHLTNVTITDNAVIDGSGGGISVETHASPPTLTNTLVANNDASTSPDVAGHFDDQGNNLIGISDGSTGFTQSTLVGTQITPINPQLAPLDNNGGTTPTHALLTNSQAIDAGNNSAAPTRDQRGVTRADSAADIGAFESNVSPVPSISPNPPVPEPTSPPEEKPSPSDALPIALTATNLAWSLITRSPDDDLEASNTGLTVNLPTHSTADLALQKLDRSLSSDYSDYYSGISAGGASIPEIKQTLHRVRRDRHTKSAIVYAIFTPKDNAHSADPDLVSASLNALERAEQTRPDDQLELILITEAEDPIRYVTQATRAEVSELAKYYRMAVADPEDDQSFKALSQQFYQWLLSPLEADLKRQAVTSLVYTLDEGLRTLPLAAMMDRDGYVIDRYAVSIIPSFGLTERSLVWLQNQTTLATGAEAFQNLEPLPAVEAELGWVQSQLGGGTSLLNEAFTRDNLIQAQNRHNPGVLHVATHAQFNPGQPQNSFIQFWDDSLSLDEVRSLNWRNSSLELLILSACTTAVGDRNAELGFAGIATASGVRSALGSLWFISDIGTVALMGEFYAQLETSQTITEALQKSQQALISGQVRLENGYLITSAGKISMPDELDLPDSFTFNHPYYWSAFALIGNPW
ncbi:MAG: CHAT domain-containing protein [Cyanobacteria bacterium P01_A01_bin.114]